MRPACAGMDASSSAPALACISVPRLEVGGGHGQGDRGQRRAECSLHHRCCTRGQGAVSGVGVHSTPRRATERMMIRGSHAWGVQGGRCRGWAARVMRGGCKRRWGTGTARTHQFLPCCYTAPQSQSGARWNRRAQELVLGCGLRNPEVDLLAGRSFVDSEVQVRYRRLV